MHTVRKRVCAVELRNTNSRILNASGPGDYRFVPKNVMHVATTIYRVAE